MDPARGEPSAPHDWHCRGDAGGDDRLKEEDSEADEDEILSLWREELLKALKDAFRYQERISAEIIDAGSHPLVVRKMLEEAAQFLREPKGDTDGPT